MSRVVFRALMCSVEILGHVRPIEYALASLSLVILGIVETATCGWRVIWVWQLPAHLMITRAIVLVAVFGILHLIGYLRYQRVRGLTEGITPHNERRPIC